MSETYYKIIGDNYGTYPYRVGLNTLKHNDEQFDPTPKCTAGGLYFCAPEYIHEYMFKYGDQLCVVSLPADAQKVQVENKFKADKIVIEKILPLSEISTWEYLKAEGFDIHAYNNYTLQLAARERHLDVVKFLIDSGSDIHADDDLALQWAAENGHLDVVKFLVENGANIHAANDYALRWAAANGHLDVVKFLVENGADIHADDDWTLQMAAGGGYLDVIKFLVEKGANIHARADLALQWATENGHLDVVDYLKSLK